jgi:hypothetical protein
LTRRSASEKRATATRGPSILDVHLAPGARFGADPIGDMIGDRKELTTNRQPIMRIRDERP